MEKIISIVFIMDNNYIVPTCVAISSLLYNMDKDYHYNIYVLMPKGTSVKNRDLIIEMGDGYVNADIIIKEAEMNDLVGLHRESNKKYLVATETALLKFKLPEIFFDLDKILYLDGDIIVRDTLVDLFYTDVSNYSIAAVRDLPQVIYKEQIIGKEISGKEYFNSGVMLLNLARMRSLKCCKQLIQEKSQQEEQALMDQNVFNIVFKNDVKQLSFLYNVCYVNMIESAAKFNIGDINEIYGTQYADINEILKDIKIIHFSSKLKPWLFYDVPLADEWIYYYKMSVFKTVPLQRIWHTRRDVDLAEVKEKVAQLSKMPNTSKRIVPVVFATNKDYAPYVAVAIQSIYEHASEDCFYDINILIDASMTNNLKYKFSILSYKDVSIKLWDVRKCFEGVNLYSVGHYSRQMYFRWLIPEIFCKYDKILYLDCDLVAQRDIAELYEQKIHDNYLGAVNNFLRDNLQDYVINKLELNTDQYYNSGVLLININEFILNKVKNKCIQLLKEKEKLACPDQDIINIVCKGKICKIDDIWNFQWHHQFSDAYKGIFVDNYEMRYEQLLFGKPGIIHYTSFIKPWKNPERKYAEIFWGYCRKTIFYEEILFYGISYKLQTSKELQKNQEMKKQLDNLQYHLDETRKSKSYKIGRIITFLPRWIRHIMFKVNM